jgi:hypothetical protein
MRRRTAVIGFAVVLVLASALPAIGASPTELIDKALKLAQQADKRSKKALKAASKAAVPGPQGATGPQGSVGPTGASGPVGPATGIAGGDLSGNYPNPELAEGSVGVPELGVIPAARLLTTTSPSVPSNNGPATPVSFDTELFDPADIHTPSSPTLLVAPVDGIYELTAAVAWEENATGPRYLGVATTDRTAGFDSGPAASDGATFQRVTSLIDMEAGEWARIELVQESGTSLEILTNEYTPEFSMHYVGPLTG